MQLLLLIASLFTNSLHAVETSFPDIRNTGGTINGPLTVTGAVTASGSLSIAGVAISSVPVMHICGNTAVGTLATGTTFLTFIPDSAITIKRETIDIVVAGIGGSGDGVTCNTSANGGFAVTAGAAAAAGATVSATGTTAAAYQAQVFCHMDSAATTRPIANVCVEYVMQ